MVGTSMEIPLKELKKLENLTTTHFTSVDAVLEVLLSSLDKTRKHLEFSDVDLPTFKQLLDVLEVQRKEVDEHQKIIYTAISRLGKALDKRFPTPLPIYPRLFESPTSRAALQESVALHFIRTGQFDVAETFIEESCVDIPSEMRMQFLNLYRILSSLKNRDLSPALEWTRANRSFLQSRSSPLEFYLHRSQYLRLLLSTGTPDYASALIYANSTLRPFYMDHEVEFKRLIGCIAYIPYLKVGKSPYSDLASPSLHSDLEPLFAKEYCASLGMSRQVPLRVVGDLGGGGALAKIEKGRKIMRERRSEWSQIDELPIEIPLPSGNRYHSVFACPVSKEQATEQNPPMMMLCGHVIAKESLHKLSKPGGRVKCPYCPAESSLGSSMRVYF